MKPAAGWERPAECVFDAHISRVIGHVTRLCAGPTKTATAAPRTAENREIVREQGTTTSTGEHRSKESRLPQDSGTPARAQEKRQWLDQTQ